MNWIVIPLSVLIPDLLFRWRIVTVMMVASLFSEVFRLHHLIFPFAAQSLGLKPKDWPAFLATQSSLLDLYSSNKVAFTGQGKGLFSRKGLN